MNQCAFSISPWQALRALTVRVATLRLFMGLLSAAVPAWAVQKPVNVLVLYSNGRLLPANIEVDRGLRDVVTSQGERPVLLFDEFLDTPQFEGPAYVELLGTYLRGKYAEHRPDVVVAGGREALTFCLQQCPTLFPGVRIVHIGASRSIMEELGLPKSDVLGTPIDYDFAGTIEWALRWHPQARHLLLVTGTSLLDRQWESRLRKEVRRFSGRVAIEFLAGLSTAEVLRRLGALRPDTVVFSPGYYVDGDGHHQTPQESVKAMAQASGAPVYGPFNTFIGTGAVGGVMVDFYAMGRRAGQQVNAVLAGHLPVATDPSEIVPNSLNVDWRQIQRWGIDRASIPGDVVVHFREPTLWEAYAREILIAVAVFLVQGALIVGLFVERRRRLAAVRAEHKQRFELVRASRLAVVGELAGAIAHEINQPLGAILSNAEAAELMLESGMHRTDEIRQILADIRLDDLRASEVILRVRALLSKHQMVHQRLDLNEVVSDVERILRAEARRRNANLDIRLPATPAMMVGDRIQIQQILINLVLNALDAIEGLPESRRTVTVSVENAEGRVRLAVQDRGAGVASEHLPRLFESFFTTKSSGMGLGLPIVRTLVDAHGGSVTADRDVAEGAVFRVEFPAADAIDKGLKSQT